MVLNYGSSGTRLNSKSDNRKKYFSKSLMVLLLPLLISSCASPKYRASVAAFGEAAKAANDQQKERLKNLGDIDKAVLRDSLAEGKIPLIPSKDCENLHLSENTAKKCTLLRQGGQSLADVETYSSIVQVSQALGNYGERLAVLAKDVSEDATAYSKSLTDLGIATNALSKSLDITDPTIESQINFGAVIVGGVGNLAFSNARIKTLRKIIIEADNDVKKAVGYLSKASDLITSRELTIAQKRLYAAQGRLTTAILDLEPKKNVAKSQGDMFEAAEQINKSTSTKNSFAALGKAHSALVKASLDNANLKDLEAAGELVVKAVETINEAAP